nr:hypothetical protein Iba_chr04fCG3500 [Ipomoea batatas]
MQAKLMGRRPNGDEEERQENDRACRSHKGWNKTYTLSARKNPKGPSGGGRRPALPFPEINARQRHGRAKKHRERQCAAYARVNFCFSTQQATGRPKNRRQSSCLAYDGPAHLMFGPISKSLEDNRISSSNYIVHIEPKDNAGV